MFSNRSVSVQPSPPPIEYAFTPEAFKVLALVRKSCQFAGAVTPAFLKASTLYQTVDLLAALKTKEYSLPSIVPSLTRSPVKFAATSSRAKSSGLSAFFSWNWWTTPGWPIAARSGGLPPSTAVPRTVGTLSPAGLYFTVTLGCVFLNPSITAWKDFCSSPVQMPTIEMLPETLALDAVVLAAVEPAAPVLLSLLSSPPQPAAARARVPSAARAAGPNR